MIRPGLCLALACLGCVRYEPQPLDPARHATELRRRDLGDTALVSAVARHAGTPVQDRWTDRQLAVAALLLRSDLHRLRAEWRVARSAVRTAGARPAVGVQGELERRASGNDEDSPWVVAVGTMLSVELGGKRGARVQAAQAEATLAETRLVGSAWTAAAATRQAAAALASAYAEVDDAREEVAALEDVHRLERARYGEAALGASDLARTATELQNARLALAEAENRILQARAALAAAVAVPVRAVDGMKPALTEPAGCAALDAAAADSFVGGALARRQEVTRALSRYAVAESRLRLEVARQYPDLELGPGFIWDQGVNRWTLALALPALLGARNRGAIAQAAAAREVAGLQVAEAQDSVLADVESAIQRCRGAALEVAGADSVVAAAGRLLERDRAAYQRGETTRLEPARSELQLLRARRAHRRAQRRLALASLDLERAAGGPTIEAAGEWPDPRLESEEETRRP